MMTMMMMLSVLSLFSVVVRPRRAATLSKHTACAELSHYGIIVPQGYTRNQISSFSPERARHDALSHDKGRFQL